jgi:hypothetical protein
MPARVRELAVVDPAVRRHVDRARPTSPAPAHAGGSADAAAQHANAFISAETWAALSKHLDTRQLLDLLFTAGNDHTNAFYTNSVVMPLSPGAFRLPN